MFFISAEPYTCTGHFEADFTELWKRAGLQLAEMPPVVIRAKRPGTPPPPDPKAKGADPTPEDHGEDENEEAKPKTYVTKEKFSYFKPKIQVEMEKEDKADTVTEVFIRGNLKAFFNIVEFLFTKLLNFDVCVV